jgi:hypothetical protein
VFLRYAGKHIHQLNHWGATVSKSVTKRSKFPQTLHNGKNSDMVK